MISKCRYYLYRLSLTGAPGAPGRVVFVGLNPGTATDAVRRYQALAKRWGFGALDVVNLFSYRTFDPGRLSHPANTPQGPDHWRHVFDVLDSATLVICAWGTDPAATPEAVAQMLAVIRSKGLTPYCTDTEEVREYGL